MPGNRSSTLRPRDRTTATRPTMRDKLGLCQWFHYEAYEDVDRTIALMRELGARHLRTGVSWADFHRPHGPQWYDWQMRRIAEAGFDVLLSVWHTPPSLAEGNICAGPPRRLHDYAAFITQLIDAWGDCFDALELWNEPNNLYKWEFRNLDPGWEKFGRMIALAADAACRRGMPTVLGGMMPVDPHWLNLMKDRGALEAVDAVGIHGFPEMWWNDAPNWEWYGQWRGWEAKVRSIAEHAEGRPIWITETGLATWELKAHRPGRHELQVDRLEAASLAPASRVYWYSVVDLAPQRDAIEGFHVDENEYHLGLVTYAGQRKPAFYRMQTLLEEPLEPPLTADPAPGFSSGK